MTSPVASNSVAISGADTKAGVKFYKFEKQRNGYTNVANARIMRVEDCDLVLPPDPVSKGMK